MKELEQGTLLQGGRYIIEKVLGQGGFGITYSGVQQALEAKVAIKEFFMKEHCNRNADTSQVTVGSEGSRDMVERFRQKFIKEARNIYRLKHKHIIPVIDVFEENGTAYYVMEHVGGGSLGDKVKSGALPEADAVRYIRQVASALDFVHSKHIMHLDVKPANILLNDDDEAVLIDFGLAKQYDDAGTQTSTTPVGISHGYAPMEQYKRGGVGTFSPATDIYSLGATLYKLVTGNTPPEASDVNDDGLPELPANISSPVRRAVEAAMQPRRKDRPQSIGEFLEIVESGKVKDDSGKWRDESGKTKDDSDGVEDCPPVLRVTSVAEEVNDSPATDDGETVVGNPSGSCHPERSQESYKHANEEILPPSGRQNDNGGKVKDESGEMKDERKGLGGTSKKKWAIFIAVLVIGAAAALFGTMSGGGSSNDYEGKLVPILDNSNGKWGYADSLGTLSGGGSSTDYEGKLVPILDNSNDEWGYADSLGTLSGGGSSTDYEGKLVPILDNSNDEWGYADSLGNMPTITKPDQDSVSNSYRKEWGNLWE